MQVYPTSKEDQTLTVNDVRGMVKWDGPTVSIEEMTEAAAIAAAESYEASLNE